MDSFSIRRFVFLGFFIAVTILLTFVFSIQTTFLRLSFSFLSIALCGAYFGAVPAGLMTAASGFIGTAVLGLGVFFPGFLLTDFLTGFLFGWVLHDHPLTVKRTAAAFFLVAVVVNLGLQTLWLTLFYGKAWGRDLPAAAGEKYPLAAGAGDGLLRGVPGAPARGVGPAFREGRPQIKNGTAQAVLFLCPFSGGDAP